MLQAYHLQEWIDSGVDPEIPRLNVRSLSGDNIYYLCYNINDRTNTGRLAAKYLNKYGQFSSGWWCDGVNIISGDESSFEAEGVEPKWGQFKPDNPRTYQKDKGFGQLKTKVIKYESPPKADTEIYALRVPLHIWQKIADRFNVSMPESLVIDKKTGQAIGFWGWVLCNPQIPVIITEGAKKAGCLLTAGYVAIALPGIFNGCRQDKDEFDKKVGLPYLIPQLEAFAVEGREIGFCFDNDSKSKTKKNVNKAIVKTGKLFERKGCAVKIVKWNHPAKGVDDLIAATDVDYFHDCYDERVPLHAIEHGEILDLRDYINLEVNEQYLPEDLPLPQNAQLIAIKSAKGTNKTGLLAAKVARNRELGIKTIVITHRIQLAKALAARFGIDHIEELRKSETRGVFGYCLCIDSVHPNSQARFNSEDWSEAHLILDEAEQIIWHMLNSATCRKNRVAILENFTQLIKTIVATSGRIYLSDADLSPIVIDYIEQLIGYRVKRYAINNIFNSNKHRNRKLIVYDGNDPRELIAAAKEAISQKKKLLIHTSGQKHRSGWGTINLERYFKKKFKKQFPDLKILRIDGESVADPQHAAYGCMGNLNGILTNYDIVLASPTIETGVSIDIKGHFDSIWCIAWGVQTVDAVCQTLERLRDDVPRHIWVKRVGLDSSFVGNGATNVKRLLGSTHRLTKANINLLEHADRNNYSDLDPDNWQKTHLLTWAKRAVIVNAGMRHYRKSILEKLELEGYSIENYDLTSEIANQIKNEIYETRDEGYAEHCQEVSEAENLSDRELEELRNNRSKTKAERLAEQKGNLRQRYQVEVTPELVEKDDRGWHSQLALHYYLTIGNCFLAVRDKTRLSNLTGGTRKAFKPDVNKSLLSAKIKCLELINITQFFGENLRFTAEGLKKWFELVSSALTRSQIKTILGVNIFETDSPIAAANKLLKLLGLKLIHVGWAGGRKNKHRVYAGCSLNPDNRDLVFNQWLKRDEFNWIE